MILLDTNCYGKLLDPKTRAFDEAKYAKIAASLRIIGREIWPSQLNALEIIRIKHAPLRDALLGVMHRLKGSRPLLPWPQDLLARAGALAQQKTRFQVSPVLLDAIVADPSLLKPAHVTFARRRITQAETNFKQSMAHGRALTRPIIKAHGGGNPWPDPQAFLELWSDPQNLAWYINRDLRAVKLSAKQVPHDLLLANPHWRLHYDAVGIAMHRQLMEPQQPRWVGRIDLVQLVHLGDADILVTDDGPFRDAARDVIDGRYGGKRVMSWQEFVDAAG